MNYWLIKSEPSVYSWDLFVKEKEASWEGVRNYAARNNLRAMKTGDEVFYYHSNEGMEIVGVARVSKENYPDPTANTDAWLTVNFQPLYKLNKPVKLSEIKVNKRLVKMALIKLSRLSVQPVTKEEWGIIMRMSGK